MKISLNYDWRFKEDCSEDDIYHPFNEGAVVDIPHCAKEMPYSSFNEEDYQKIYSYEKNFDVSLKEDKRYFLLFEGFMLQADIYLNGENLGHHISGWIPVEIEITSYLKDGRNRLYVRLDSREDSNIPPFGKAVDYLTFSGIYRPVYLLERNKEFIKRVSVIRADDHQLVLDTQIEGEGKAVYTLYDKEGNKIKEFNDDHIELENLHLWSIDDPYLYTLSVSFKGEEKTLHIGFRTIEAREDGFYLNHKKIKLIGLNRHQNYPYVGGAMPKSAQREDADIIKGVGCNLVRTSHYPQSEDFLCRCDEIGLLVQTEVPGWQYVSKDNIWRENFLHFIKEMVYKEQNHPSLIAYGVRVDESIDDEKLYSKANEICHSLDKNRPTTGVRNFKDSQCLEDFYSYNDFSCSSLKHGLDKPKTIKGAKGKGVLDSENNGHMFPTKMYDGTQRRIEHALRHLRVMDDAFKYENYYGAIGWCAFDYNTHKDFGSGDRICYHGVMDMYRNYKDAAYAYKSQMDDKPLLHVCNIVVSGDNDEANNKPFVVFTNCDSIHLYRNGKFVKEFYPDRKEYPNIKHPPIIIDDFIGGLFDEGLSKKDSLAITSALNYVARVGYTHLNYIHLLKAVFVLKKNHLPIQQMFDWYYKYVSGWGEKVNSFELKGIKKNKEIISTKLEPSMTFDLEVKTDKVELINEDTYDVSRVSISYVDQNHHQQHYAFLPLTLKTKGPIEVIGPKLVSLQGGDISVYVRSKKMDANMEEAILIIQGTSFTKEVKFKVRQLF